MSWFLLALLAPFFYAITNHIDKALLEKYFRFGGVGTLILFSSLLSILAIPIILIADSSVLDVGKENIGLLTVVAILDVAILWFYLLALKGDEPSIIIVFYQLVPVLALILGYFILEETLTTQQLAAMAIIIIGTSLVSFEIDDQNNFRLRRNTVIFMTAAAFCWALESVVFKVAAIEENVWRSLFWEHVILVVIGLLIFSFIRTYRIHFLEALRSNSAAILSLNVTNESLFMIGNITVAFAVMLAPVSLILLGESFQTIFVLLIGIFLTHFFPHIYYEKIEKRYIIQKTIAILITGLGTYILLIM